MRRVPSSGKTIPQGERRTNSRARPATGLERLSRGSPTCRRNSRLFGRGASFVNTYSRRPMSGRLYRDTVIFIQFEAMPTQAVAERDNVAGAHVNCWIQTRDPEQAEARGRHW